MIKMRATANTDLPLPLFAVLVLATVIIIVHLFIRPIMPIDETRYISVAWEMWQSGNWLVPHENGQTYAHKPPMLFWLINLAWALVGVSEWAARSIIPLCSLANFVLLHYLAKALIPNCAKAAQLAPVVLLASAAWLFYLPTTMFDLLLSVFVLGFSLAIVHASNKQVTQLRYWLAAALMITAGLLTKGPVMLLYCLPFALLYSLWRQPNSIKVTQFIARCGIATLMGIGLMLLWVIPAVISGGESYENELLWQQTSGRMVNSFAHARPVYWYLMLLPALLLPLPLLRSFWRGLRAPLSRLDKALLLYLAILVGCFSMISGKQIHYLIPLFPFAALWVAHRLPLRLVREWPLTLLMLLLALTTLSMPLWLKSIETPNSWYWLGLIPLALMCFAVIGNKRNPSATLTTQLLLLPIGLTCSLSALAPVLQHAYNIEPIAHLVARYQQQGKTVASWQRYHNQFGFYGRLQQPLVDISEQAETRLRWAQNHPDSLILLSERQPNPRWFEVALAHQSYRGRQLFIVRAADVTDELSQLAAAQSVQGNAPASPNCHKDCLTLAD
ncbi:glycosyltransferase family 39 protein [Shewanella avicenniae]|uniref:Glycosyltransferase family 39 protein n=1 Tax=Shewanella avicenniae TaxID=2814294 RepID=A0ABX7QNA3_9GAMM|nr:glycosyltransferase family 39 protein [Shewanella avicenniae]QSX32942.1 glycosyltransferase family 39 protein [Shewanella avicenniae]